MDEGNVIEEKNQVPNANHVAQSQFGIVCLKVPGIGILSDFQISANNIYLRVRYFLSNFLEGF